MTSRKSVIIFNHVSKSFQINRENRLKSGLANIFQSKSDQFMALKNVNLSIRKNEFVGLYGPNGSGKTVILKLIAGIMIPDSGKVTVQGRVAPIIEFGAALHPELSGLDNIFLYSAILGISRQEVKAKLDRIIDFSEIGRFLNTPIKKYSSGMKARLGFSVAIFSDPDILLVDEALSVGDSSFQTRATEKLRELSKRMTIIISSHNPHLLVSLCDRVIQMKTINQSLSNQDFLKLFVSIPLGFSFKLEATSSSMAPVIVPGDQIVIEKVPYKDLKEGKIIAFLDENMGNIVVHRVYKITYKNKEFSVLTKGDSAFSPDPWELEESSYIGVVTKINQLKSTTRL